MVSCEEQQRIIVIDNGSDTIKAGFADEKAARCVFPSAIGYPKSTHLYKAIPGVEKGFDF